ncbi:hypothetical protein RJ639_008793 [Escallonia herrerae]|uniref:DUF4220 domain-containing protein n=1 Tax=Escallonia herrerae TaxID=1293975 RepID=A0AA89AQ73_9ASTE|nr:hypothetical protein RJ639_008793 [Escallonia herrerae]
MADWVAVVALGKLSDFASQGDSSSRSNKDGPNSALMALWAPLLLLHLGGLDTITAFSVEDIQLWLRHLVGLVVQVTLVIYIFLRCWTNQSHPLLILSIPTIVAGVIKYEAARAWWDSTPNFEANPLTEFLQGSSDPTRDIFWLIEIQLGLMYDLFYTKATSIYCTAGCILRSISFICMVTVLVAFSMIRKGAEYSKVDIDITYLLLVGAVVLEVYGLTLMISSEWMILWMVGHWENRQLRGSGALESHIEDPHADMGSAISLDRVLIEEKIARKHNKWEILSELWAELLCHGAARCPLNRHYENIRRGGEFLTHVWLLLTWHGLTDIGYLAHLFLQRCARLAVRSMDSSSNI